MSTRLLTTLAGLAVAAAAPVTIARPAAARPAAEHAQPDRQADQRPAPERTEERVEVPEVPEPLVLGAEAPEPSLGEFIKGESFDEFEDGQVYVMEYWATWCGPCIRGFPHLTELQEKHGDKVKIVGVNIWEREPDYQARTEQVKDFVESREDMGYTVAIDDKEKSGENEWMRAAGRNGIPSAFIVDQQGRVAWMGHPMAMDEPLSKIIEGNYEIEEPDAEALKASREQMAQQAWQQAIFGAIQEGRFDAAYATVEEELDGKLSDQGEFLNQLSWFVMTHPLFEGHRDMGFARKAAEQAAEATDRKNADILDTLARAYWESGDKAKAVQTQEEAIQAADDPTMKSTLQETLQQYQSEMPTS